MNLSLSGSTGANDEDPSGDKQHHMHESASRDKPSQDPLSRFIMETGRNYQLSPKYFIPKEIWVKRSEGEFILIILTFSEESFFILLAGIVLRREAF